MTTGQKCALEANRKRQLCMSQENKEKYRELSKNRYQRDNDKIKTRSRMIYKKAKEYIEKCK